MINSPMILVCVPHSWYIPPCGRGQDEGMSGLATCYSIVGQKESNANEWKVRDLKKCLQRVKDYRQIGPGERHVELPREGERCHAAPSRLVTTRASTSTSVPVEVAGHVAQPYSPSTTCLVPERDPIAATLRLSVDAMLVICAAGEMELERGSLYFARVIISRHPGQQWQLRADHFVYH